MIEIIRKIRAHFRAKRLFLNSLSELDRRDFYAFGIISAIGNVTKSRYIIYTRRGLTYNILRIEDMTYICFAPKGDLPYWDAILAQKLMLECNEKEVFRKAHARRLDIRIF